MKPGGAAGSASNGGEHYRFDRIEVDVPAHTLSRDAQPQALEPKAFAVLVALLRRPGELLGREELLDGVWGHRHVTPGVLTRAIAQLRSALEDDVQHPRYIQTQHALGYRFIGELQSETPAGADVAGTGVEGDDSGSVAIAVPADDVSVIAPIVAPASAAPPGGHVGNDSAHDQGPHHVHEHRWWMPVALLAVVVVASSFWSGRSSDPDPAGASIAVMPFENLGKNRDDDYFAEGLALEMHDALADVQGLTVAAEMSPAAAATRETDVKALGKRLGVATVLDASVRREGTKLRINARLSDTSTGYTIWSRSYDHEVAGVFETQTEIADEVLRSLLGAIPGRNQALARRLAPTRSVAAFDAYLMGLQQLRLSAVDGNFENAIGLFKQALAADRGFALAQAGICRSELFRFESLRDATAFERARGACVQAAKMDPSLGEVDLALGELHQARGEFDQAVAYYSRAEASPALQADAYLGMAKAYAGQDLQGEARDYFERARRLRPGDASLLSAIGYWQYSTNHLDEALESYRQATRLRPGDAELWSSLGGLYVNAGNNGEAAKAFERSIGIRPTDAVLSNYGALKYQEGDYVAAATLFRRALEIDSGDFQIWGYLAEALLAAPATADRSREPFLRAAQMAQQYLEIKPEDARALAALGWYQVNLGDAGKARELIARSESLGTERGEVGWYNAQTLTIIGSREEVMARVASARDGGISESMIGTNPFLKRFHARTEEKSVH
jgi:TolB-like protein/DNA-binding winged helix-turn-helix (wHTH) protein/Flp pilus assembly protein TadD